MHKILMIGAGRDVRGGVSTVVNGYYEASLDKRVDLTYLPTMKDGNKIKKLLVAIIARIRFIYLMPQNNILHVHLSNDASFYRKRIFILSALKQKKKVIIHLHGSTFDEFYLNRCNEKQKKWIREIFEKANAIIALSDAWKEFIVNTLLSGKSSDKVKVIYNAVPIPMKEKEDYHDSNILFLGKMGKRKGTYDLIEAIKNVIPEYPDVKLYLGGDGEVEKIRSLVEKYKLHNNVDVMGWVDSNKKESQIDKSSIFVLPSYNEGMPMSVLEAMSHGMAVISTYVGGIPHIINSGENGLLFNAGNVEALSDLIKKLLSDNNLKKELGKKAAKTISEKFDIRVTIEKVIELYEEIDVI